MKTAAETSHLGEAAYSSGSVTVVPHTTITGGVAVGDLLGTGQLDIVAGDSAGHLYAWDAQGRQLPGFPVHTDPIYSQPAIRDEHNRLLPAIFAAPALAHLTGATQLDIVASSEDRHVYAWDPHGRLLPGYPVLVVDKSEVQSIDPVTQHVTFKASAQAGQGAKLVDTPAIGALDGSGSPDIVVDTNEEYGGAPNVSIDDPLLAVLGDVPLLSPANSRVYALNAQGRLLKGWPVGIGDLDAELLPDVGDGATRVAGPWPISPATGSWRSGSLDCRAGLHPQARRNLVSRHGYRRQPEGGRHRGGRGARRLAAVPDVPRTGCTGVRTTRRGRPRDQLHRPGHQPLQSPRRRATRRPASSRQPARRLECPDRDVASRLPPGHERPPVLRVTDRR